MNMVCYFSEFTKVCDYCYCGSGNREDVQGDISLNDCKAHCSSDSSCKGIEYWSGLETNSQNPRQRCLKCLNPRSTVPFTNENDPAFPPSVYTRGIT